MTDPLFGGVHVPPQVVKLNDDVDVADATVATVDPLTCYIGTAAEAVAVEGTGMRTVGEQGLVLRAGTRWVWIGGTVMATEIPEAVQDVGNRVLDAQEMASEAVTTAGQALEGLAEAIKATVSEYAVGESETLPPTSGWSEATPARTPGSYIWMRTRIIRGNDTEILSNPVLLTGNDGADGAQGLPGEPGADGQSLFTWLKYADDAAGNGISDLPEGKTHMGLALNRPTPVESSDPADYSWSLIKGTDGVPGEPGDDGQSLFTWVKYATSAAGAGMSDDPTGRTHIGLAYNKTTATESTNPADYTWSLIQGPQGAPGEDGEQGEPGADGRGIASTTVTYQASSSGTVVPTGTWVASPPAAAAGQYVWTRTVITYTSGSPATTTSYSVGRIGTDGSDGADGRGVASATVHYQLSASGTTVPTGAWLTTPPVQTVALPFLWTRTITSYTSGSPTTAYSVSRRGDQGDQGVSVTSIVSYYRLLAAGSAQPAIPSGASPAGWSTTEHTYTPGQELWRSERVNLSNGSYSYTIPQKSSAYAAAVHVGNLAEAATQGLVKIQQADPGHYPGRIWWQTDANGEGMGIKISNGSIWQSYMLLADQVLVPSSVGAVLIANGAVIAQALYSELIEGLIVNGGVFTGGRFQTSEQALRGIKIDAATNQLVLYSPTGQVLFTLTPGGGAHADGGYTGSSYGIIGSGSLQGTYGGVVLRSDGTGEGYGGYGELRVDSFGRLMFVSHPWSATSPAPATVTTRLDNFGDSGWVNLPVSGGVTGTLEYRIKAGRCEIRGEVIRVSGAYTSSFTQVATLPAAARPSSTFRLLISGDSPALGVLEVNVASAGGVSIRAIQTGPGRAWVTVPPYSID